MRFYTDGLLSKWGFGDGDCLDDLLWDAEETGTIPRGVNQHDVLRAVVRRFVAPQLDQAVDLEDVGTIHNPIRAKSVDGVACDWYAFKRNPPLTPEFVDIDDAVILAIAREFAPYQEEGKK